MNTSRDKANTRDSLVAFANGSSDGWWHAKDTLKEVSRKPDDDKKSMPTLTHIDIDNSPIS
jgi:hypothetical protein